MSTYLFLQLFLCVFAGIQGTILTLDLILTPPKEGPPVPETTNRETGPQLAQRIRRAIGRIQADRRQKRYKEICGLTPTLRGLVEPVSVNGRMIGWTPRNEPPSDLDELTSR